MITVKNSLPMADLLRVLRDIPARVIPFAASTALTKIAQQAAKEALPAEMRRVFDRPTPYALNSLFVVPSTTTSLSARVMVKNTAGRGVAGERFLQPGVEGGGRGQKGLERALTYAGVLRTGESVVPSRDMPLDSFGNVPAARVRSILSQVKARGEKRTATGVFAGAVGRKGTRGVWQGQGKGKGVKPLFIFVKKPTYQPVFDFTGVVEKLAKKDFAAQFSIAAQKITARGGA